MLKDPNGPQAALVAIDPRTGEVLAMVGGSNYRESQFNLAVQGERQPGSAFKPFVLGAALDAGISPATHFESHQVVIPLGDRLWQVNNYEGSYLGDIDLEHGDDPLRQLRLRAADPARRAAERRAASRGARGSRAS